MSDVTMVKIKSYKAALRGKRGIVISLPPVWIDDNEIKSGDTLSVYRDSLDRLVIVKDAAK
jgi:hypothetical protein